MTKFRIQKFYPVSMSGLWSNRDLHNICASYLSKNNKKRDSFPDKIMTYDVYNDVWDFFIIMLTS